MSSPTASRGSPISQHLRAAKDILQGLNLGTKIADKAEFDALEKDAFEILHLLRFWRNAVAPINRVPPEILALIPDYLSTDWEPCDRDPDVIALTHVCRAWRGLFISQSSLWTDIDCEDVEKADAYLERSNSSPVNLYLRRDEGLLPHDSFFHIIPLAIGRLKSLTIEGTRENLQDITAHLTRPAPLLEELSICGGSHGVLNSNPMLTPTLFDGDLSSLRELALECVRTELPWRNMTNLTWFLLCNTSSVSMQQLLDFLESAPHLRDVDILGTPISGTQYGRVVSLACLKRMSITSGLPPILLDHLLIPTGAELTTQVKLPGLLIKDHLPRSLDNLKNFSAFTKIQLPGRRLYRHIQFSGPNGRVEMIAEISQVDETRETSMLFECLAQFDTSKTIHLEIDYGGSPSSDHPHRALLPMKDLLTLTLSLCASPQIFIYALDPTVGSSGVLVCPKLEEIIIEHRGEFDIESILRVAAARASRGAKLKLVRIVTRGGVAEIDASELKKHVLHVECSHKVDIKGYLGDKED